MNQTDASGIHPLLIQDYALYTKPIDEMYHQITHWIDCRVTGAYVYGLSRTGKSKAVKEWFPTLLQENYGDRVAIYRCIYERQSQPSQLGFARALARGLQHRFPGGVKTRDLEWRIANFFIVRGLRTKLHQVVLFIDEAQYLREAEFHSLCNLQNLAEDRSVRLSVISVGTQQLQQQRQAFILGHNTHLSTRFFGNQARFRGIRSAAELGHVFDGFDTQSDWPEDSGTSYTKYFFPMSYKEGFRFAHYAEVFWGGFQDLAPASLRDKLEVPMEYVVSPIELICRNLATDSPDFTLSKKTFMEILKQTSYFSVMREIMRSRVLGREATNS